MNKPSLHSVDRSPIKNSSYQCGLANLGNTCFLNSCLQILNCVDEIERIVSRNAFAELEETELVQNWIELREFMLRDRVQPIVVNPIKFVKSVHSLAQKKGRELFTGWAQNDLPEFLQFLIECAHNTRKRAIKMRINGIAENSTDNLALKCYTMLKTEYERGDYSEYGEMFYGIYVSRLFTQDGAVTTSSGIPGTIDVGDRVVNFPEFTKEYSCKPESYCILDLPIPESRGSPVSLIDCFDLFVQDELLSGWRNEVSGNIEPVKKNIVFWNFPRILMITLKRYSSDGRHKNNALVDFPTDQPLDLSKYIIGYKATSYKYKLFGVANHMGGVNGGHYTAFIRPNGEKWLCCNDTSVSEMAGATSPISDAATQNPRIKIRGTNSMEDHSDVVTPAAYCLFYRKI